MKPTFLKGVALGALVGSMTLVATAAVAGTGVGGVFNLGKSNSVNGTTTLTGSTNGQQLKVVNTNTGSATAGIGIQTPTNKPPLVVNSSQKVGHLNADLLDGIDSSALQKRVTSTCPNGRAITKVNANGTAACNSSYVIPYNFTVPGASSATEIVVANDVKFVVACEQSNQSLLSFTNLAGPTATYSYSYSGSGSPATVTSYTVGLSTSETYSLPFTLANFYAQITYATNTYILTMQFHAADHGTSCTFEGNATVALLPG